MTDSTHIDKIPVCIPSRSAGKCNYTKGASLAHSCTTMSFSSKHKEIIFEKELMRDKLKDAECQSEQCIVYPIGKIGNRKKLGVVYQLECLNLVQLT